MMILTYHMNNEDERYRYLQAGPSPDVRSRL